MTSRAKLSLLTALVLAVSLGAKGVRHHLATEAPHEDRSGDATRVLAAQGFPDIRVLDGGMVFGRKGACEVLALAVSTDGWQRDALVRLVPEGGRIELGNAASTEVEPDLLKGATGRFLARLKQLVGIAAEPATERALILSEHCRESDIQLRDWNKH